jgi:hypothetical protein
MTAFEYAAELGYQHFATKGAWFRVTGTRGNAKGHYGVEGQLMWIAVEGNANAWPSSPEYPRVTRVGLKIAGRSGYLFLNANHVTWTGGQTSPEALVSIELMCHAFASFAA